MAKRKSHAKSAKLERCVLSLKRQGKSKSAAFAICNAAMSKKRRKG